MINLDTLLQGSIDMHLHHGPDPIAQRRTDALQAAQQAKQAGMKAIVLKSHHYPTAPLAIAVGNLVPEISILGSISLNHGVGGLNSSAVEASAKLGAKVVWMPTLSSINSRLTQKNVHVQEPGISLLDDRGELVPEIHGILSLIKEYDMVLATGHISPRETFAVVESALAIGIRKIVITHAEDTDSVKQSLTLKDQQLLAQMGAFIEYTCVGLLPTWSRRDPKNTAEGIRTIGAKHLIISTDLGQIQNPTPVEGMRLFMAILINQGVDANDIELMAKVNPLKLLNP